MQKIITILCGMSLLLSTQTFAQNNSQKTNNVLLSTYANIALDNYQDALNDAKLLQQALHTFKNSTNKTNFDNAKIAWLIARESYGQSEAFRLANGPIDAEEGWVADKYGAPEGQLNAWPLDENLIDYIINTQGQKTKGNIIDTIGTFTPEGKNPQSVNTRKINQSTIATLNENGGEANVATGYHAIEFLLWGQDQDYANFIQDNITRGALAAGQRQYHDFTTAKNASRRLDYLVAAADLIVEDLSTIITAWAKNDNTNYRAALLGYHQDHRKNITPSQAKVQIFAGMGIFIKSELANERIAVALLTPSEEDEQSCFSDNTHRDIAMNYQGFKNILMGTYRGVDYGVAPIDAVANPSEILTLLKEIEAYITQMDAIAKNTRHFDYQIRPNDPQAKNIKRLKNKLKKLGEQMLIVAKANATKLSITDITNAKKTKL